VLPAGVPKLSVEAGVAMGWRKWVDASVSLEHFGASAPAEILIKEYGFTADNDVKHATELIAGTAVPGAQPGESLPPGTPQG
jgi:transketolase